MTQPIYPNQLKVTAEYFKGVSQSNDPQIHAFSDIPQTEFTALYDGLIRKLGYSEDKALAAIRACVILSQVINELKIDQRLNTSEDALHSAVIVHRVVTLMGDTPQTETMRRQLTAYHLALNGAEPKLLQTHLAAIEHPIRHTASDSPFADAHVQIQNDFTPTPLKTTQPHNGYTLETNRINALQDALVQQAYTTKQTELAAQQLARVTELRDLCTQPLPTLLVTMDDNPCLNKVLGAEKANNTDIQQTTQTDTQPHSLEDDMNLKYIATTIATTATLLGGAATIEGCTQKIARTADGQFVSVDNFRITKNPHPTQGYKIHVFIKDAPGPFEDFGGSVGFRIENVQDCGYHMGWPVDGTVLEITDDILFPLTKISDTEYEGVFYTDWAVDGDFFWKGVCHWQWNSMGVGFSAKANQGNTSFITSYRPVGTQIDTVVQFKELRDGVSQTRYYLKSKYPKIIDLPNYGNWGIPSGSSSLPYHKPEDLFSITTTIEEIK